MKSLTFRKSLMTQSPLKACSLSGLWQINNPGLRASSHIMSFQTFTPGNPTIRYGITAREALS
uniref:Uncharacterized protein n=1 Tax=Arundo donax TaxID=35708 RepID=A0A0A8ZT21_ARUDO